MADLDAQARSREAFDPDGRMNPRKVLPAGSKCGELSFPQGSCPRVHGSSRGHPWQPGRPLQDAQGRERCRALSEIVGGGSGGRAGLLAPPPDDLVATRTFDRIIAYEPADLIVTVEAGVPAQRLQQALAAHGQTWIQAPDIPGGDRGWPARARSQQPSAPAIRRDPDSLLQVVIVTGDGRLVQAGGKTVKGVAGYDIRAWSSVPAARLV